MVEDFEEGRILGELQELDEEINLITACQCDSNFTQTLHTTIFARILDKLKREKERQQMRLRAHRQKVKDSGIKF